MHFYFFSKCVNIEYIYARFARFALFFFFRSLRLKFILNINDINEWVVDVLSILIIFRNYRLGNSPSKIIFSVSPTHLSFYIRVCCILLWIIALDNSFTPFSDGFGHIISKIEILALYFRRFIIILNHNYYNEIQLKFFHM